MNMLKKLINYSLKIKKRKIVINIISITTAFSTLMCSTKEKNSEIYDNSLHGINYDVFEQNKEGLILPKYNFVDENYKGLNDSIKAYYYTSDKLYLKSFLAFPEKYFKNTFISFSDDTISINQKLKISMYKNGNIYEVFYKNRQIITKEKVGSVSVYYIPMNKIGIDTVNIKQKLTNKYINFIFWVTKQNIPRKDSILFYNTAPNDSIEIELIKKILKAEPD